MTILRAECDWCGTVEFSPDNVLLTAGEPPTYSFQCPLCRSWMHRPTSQRIVKILRALEVDTDEITEREIARFVERLGRADVLAELDR